ncbi:MAG: DUF853 family protein, partial [Lysobacter sp.]|nr:DUF853 family protein [Lysobacter sp.]
RALIVPPACRIGAISETERASVRARSPVGAKYDNAVDRESAYEILSQRTAATAATPAPAPGAPAPAPDSSWGAAISKAVFGSGRREGMLEAMAKSAARNAGGQLGRSILRGVLGSILKK